MGHFGDVANEISTITRQELAVLTIKEKDIVSKIAEIPDRGHCKTSLRH